MNPINLLGLTEQELGDFAELIDEPRYRGKQLFQWLYARGVTDFAKMTDLGKSFRELLTIRSTVAGLRLITQQRSTDSTTKFLWELTDGAKIESVLIPPVSTFKGSDSEGDDEQRRLTLCVSTQIGCPLDCKFCATATMGYARNLTVGEIVDQVLQTKHISGKKITNIVFMGMGEPMMNYDNVMNAVEIITSGIGITARRITVSTAGWADRIRQMADENRKVKLAVSLHSADDDIRTSLMPINKKFPLDTLMSSLEYYYAKTKQRVTYEYIFFDGLNDTDRDVAKLVKLARRVPSKLNVIPFHSIDFTSPRGFSAQLKPSRRTDVIVEKLRNSNLTVFQRSSAGEDIDAACGQLAVKNDQKQRGRSSRTAMHHNATVSPRHHPSSPLLEDD